MRIGRARAFGMLALAAALAVAALGCFDAASTSSSRISAGIHIPGHPWIADHSGWLVKVDPATLEVVARQRLQFGPHGVVVTDRAVYVADAHADRLLEADPETAKIRRIVKLSPGSIFPVVGVGSIWSSSPAQWTVPMRDDRVLRIDPATLRIAETLHVGGNVPSVGFGFGSAWAADQTGQVVRITPAR